MWFSVLSRLGLPYVRSPLAGALHHHVAFLFWENRLRQCFAPSELFFRLNRTVLQRTLAEQQVTEYSQQQELCLHAPQETVLFAIAFMLSIMEQ
ncbi:MAG: hypothetical protein KME52_32045 [Desmonostoc geniculatum HA4340-LM1]|jgi:hypothetical protein|nr:hypothetical protein [Desmonostoc geniculatum HA4340-LM1]